METSEHSTTVRCHTVHEYLAYSLRLVISVLMIAMVYIAFVYMPVTYGDWYKFFKPASLAISDPYEINGVLNPPWAFVLLYPLAQLPGRLSGAGLALLSIIAVVMYARSPWKALAICASAPFVFVIVLGQLDALILFGFILPESISSLLILVKPQGAFLTILNRLNIKSLVVLAVSVILSLGVWNLWPIKVLRYGLIPDVLRNASLFPYSLPIAFILAYYGVRRRSDALLCWATLCAVPFFQTHSILPAIATSIHEVKDWRIWLLLPILSWFYYAFYVGWVN